METQNILVSLLVVFVSVNSNADTDLDVYHSYLQDPGLMAERTDDPRVAEVQDLIQSLAPEINFHPEERYLPMDPLEFISRSSLKRGKFGNTDLVSSRGEFVPESLATLDKSYFLDHKGSRRAPLVRPGLLLWRLSPTSLVNRLPSRPGARWVIIEYWFATAHNGAGFIFNLGNHEGEWEGQGYLVELSTDSEGKLQHRFGGAYYAHHLAGTWYCPNELEWTEGSVGEGHPRVYSARGTHASYSKPGNFSRGPLGLLGADHTRSGGVAFQGWENLRPVVLEPYYGFKGGWGERRLVSSMNGQDAPHSEKFYPRETGEKALNRFVELLQNRCGINTARPPAMQQTAQPEQQTATPPPTDEQSAEDSE